MRVLFCVCGVWKIRLVMPSQMPRGKAAEYLIPAVEALGLPPAGIKRERKPRMDQMFQRQGTCLTIYLPEELDHPNSDQIREESDKILEEHHIKSIVFDFKKTSFMDSSGIGVIMGRYRALGLRGGSISAVHVNKRINKILHLSGMHKVIEISQEEDWQEKEE